MMLDATVVDTPSEPWLASWGDAVPSTFPKRRIEDSRSASVEDAATMSDHAPPTLLSMSPPPARAIEAEPSSGSALALGYGEDEADPSEEATLGDVPVHASEVHFEAEEAATWLPAAPFPAFRSPIVPDDMAEKTIEDEAIVDQAIGAHQRRLFIAGIAVLGLMAGIFAALLFAS